MSYKIVKTDTKYNTGLYIAKVTVGGSVWFLKQESDDTDNVLAHGKYRKMLDLFKFYIHKVASERGDV